MTEEKKQSLHPISRILCAAYNVLHKKGEVYFELQDEHADKIDSVVKTIEGTWFGVAHFNTLEKKAAGYFCFIIKDHPVVDGNKRLALLWLEIFCDAMNLKINLPSDMTLDKLAVSVEQTKDLTMENLCEIVRIILFKTPKNK